MPRRVPTLAAIIWSFGLTRGLIITKKPPPSTTDGDEGMVTASKIDREKYGERRDSNVTKLRADQGEQTCTEDPNLVVRYVFSPDRRQLVPGQVLTAFLATGTFCSEHEESEHGVGMEAWSSDHRVRIWLNGVAAGLTWGMARMALRTLWQEVVMGFRYGRGGFVEGPRWERVTFVLEYRGVRVGQGWMG